MQNHRASKATSVLKGIAAELPSTQNIRFMMKNKENTMLRRENKINQTHVELKMSYKSFTHPGLSMDVSKTFDFHFSPPKLLYILADT